MIALLQMREPLQQFAAVMGMKIGRRRTSRTSRVMAAPKIPSLSLSSRAFENMRSSPPARPPALPGVGVRSVTNHVSDGDEKRRRDGLAPNCGSDSDYRRPWNQREMAHPVAFVKKH